MRLAFVIMTAAFVLAGCGGPGGEKASNAQGSAGTNAAPPGAAPASPMPTDAPQYVALVAAGDMFEIQSARIALDKAESAEVRGLAQMILADHERASTQLTAAAVEAGSPISGAPALGPTQHANIEALLAAQRPAFDAEWLHQQVVAHQQALDAAAAYARGGDSAPLRRHAAATIAPIQTHLTRARRLEAETLARAQQQE